VVVAELVVGQPEQARGLGLVAPGPLQRIDDQLALELLDLLSEAARLAARLCGDVDAVPRPAPRRQPLVPGLFCEAWR